MDHESRISPLGVEAEVECSDVLSFSCTEIVYHDLFKVIHGVEIVCSICSAVQLCVDLSMWHCSELVKVIEMRHISGSSVPLDEGRIGGIRM